MGLLSQKSHARPCMQAHLAVVGLVIAREQPQERRFADAVGSHQTDAVAGE
jgi:hypothetical protein